MKNGPADLPGVLREVTAALIDGDWIRHSGKSADRFFYIIRERDHQAAVFEPQSFDQALSLGPAEPDLFEEWYVQAALAESTPDHWERARHRLAVLGARADRFDGLIAAIEAHNAADAKNHLEDLIRQLASRDRYDDVVELCCAVRVARTQHGELDLNQSDRPGLRRALEARLLRDLVERFPKVVNRAVRFDWLAFADPQVREASRCYLYGFFSAAVLMSATALETHLKAIAPSVKWGEHYYDRLVDGIFGPLGVKAQDGALAAALKDLFRLRNGLVHQGLEPTAEETWNALDLVRNTLELVRE